MLIGISGKMRAGKDTTASMLSYILNGRNKQVSFNNLTYDNYLKYWLALSSDKAYVYRFADAMKECLAICLGVPREEFESQEFKASDVAWLNMTVRELLQKFGTAIRNEVDPKFWVKVLLSKYNPENSAPWLISDVRFISEAHGIKELHGILIRVNRNTSNLDTHVSEVELDNYPYWDYVIKNNKTLEDLFNECKRVCIDLESKS